MYNNNIYLVFMIFFLILVYIFVRKYDELMSINMEISFIFYIDIKLCYIRF